MSLPYFEIKSYQDKVINQSNSSSIYRSLNIWDILTQSFIPSTNHYSTSFLCQTLHNWNYKDNIKFLPSWNSYCLLLFCVDFLFISIFAYFALILSRFMYTSPWITYILLKAGFGGEINNMISTKLDDKW